MSAGSPFTFTSGMTALTHSPNELVASAATSCDGYPLDVSWMNNSGMTVRGTENRTEVYQPGQAAELFVSALGNYESSWTVTYLGGSSGNTSLGVIATRGRVL